MVFSLKSAEVVSKIQNTALQLISIMLQPFNNSAIYQFINLSI